MLNLNESQFEIVTCSGHADGLKLIKVKNGSVHAFHLENASGEPAVLREVVVHRQAMGYPANTRFYAEGSNMLSQYWGTIGQIQSTVYTDRLHYRFPVRPGMFTVYNLIQFFPDGGGPELAGFTSCRRFTNEIRFNGKTIEFVIDCDNIVIPPHGTLELEELFVTAQGGREEQLAQFADRIARHHPRPQYDKPLTGWCSWYCYGPAVRESDIEENCRAMKKLPGFRYVQIDDGYQMHMGDWLIPHPNFPGGVKELCGKIRKMGLEPALWAAPFIAEEESELLTGWDELLMGGTYDFRRAFWANNFIRLRLPKGKTVAFESFEPYAMRCAAVAVLSGRVRVRSVRLREYAFDASHFLPRDGRKLFSPEENAVYQAACETFRQNTVDVFMDCPGRERAGWLCDSFFMARAEFFLTGRSDVEDDFLENYFLPDSYPLPEEWMIPMCFPADNPRKSFLPQWPFWLFLEIFEKRKRGRGRDFTGLLEPRFRKYIAGCGRCRNREGFLENLPGWNFIEWSRAEEFFQGVHFPTNMLYRKCLKEAGLCYGDRAFLDQSEELQEKIIERSFDGEWFRDNAPDGGPLPEKGGNISEICQYYADFCLELSDADPRFAGWRKRLLDGKESPILPKGRCVPPMS